VGPEVGHAQVTQKQPAVGVRVGPHPPITLRGERGQLGPQPPVGVEQLLGLVAAHPGIERDAATVAGDEWLAPSGRVLDSMLYLLTSTTASGHLMCRDCHTVTTTALTTRLHDAHGFTPDPGHLSITGRCATCSTNNTVPRSPV
jgi:hypothetical protein